MPNEPCGNDSCIDIKELNYLRSRNEILKTVEEWLAGELRESLKWNDPFSGYRSALIQLRTILNGGRP